LTSGSPLLAVPELAPAPVPVQAPVLELAPVQGRELRSQKQSTH